MTSIAGRWRGLAANGAVALAALLLLGCGGKFPCDLEINPDACPKEPRSMDVAPRMTTIQVGGTATFSASATNLGSPRYQWFRTSGSGPEVAIAGATAPTYTLSGAQLVDDGTIYSMTVTGSLDGKLFTARTLNQGSLAVSSMPGVVFEDGEFAPADWTSAAISEPAVGGPIHDQTQATSEGNPGAWRKVTITMPAGHSRLRVLSTYRAATYEPASQGPIYLIDLSLDCMTLPGWLGAAPTLLLEQAGRRYTAWWPHGCDSTWSNRTVERRQFGAADFSQVDGPACAAGQSCPDFSATGPPIGFGFTHENRGLAESAGGSGGFGIDNWKVTVWRR